ncbi:MAG TPA: hypothetical protein VE673_18495, partial [Pseudonocardiaceae bacterium]|nr:hypothetical protein [Pseudonocardiaceae bacterium]
VAVMVGGSAWAGQATVGEFAAHVKNRALGVSGRAVLGRAGDDQPQRAQALARAGAVACSAGTQG